MDSPPLAGDPYTWLNIDPVNDTRQGVGTGWDAIRYLWGTVAQQACADLDVITFGGGSLV
jgi:hypothetical protein